MSKKFLWVTIAAALFLALVVATIIMHTQRGPDTIRVGYVPIADAAQVFVGIEQGYFENHGLKIELVQMTSGPKILEALGAGSIEMGLTSTVPFLVARESGLDFVAVTGGPVEDRDHAEHAIIVRHDSPLRSVADLKGKRIAISGLRNIDDFMVTSLLAKNNVKRDEVTFTEIPFPRMPTVIEAKNVDAAAAIEPFVTLAVQSGTARILVHYFPEVLPRVPVATWVIRKKWANEHPDLAEAIHATLLESTRFILANESKTRDIVGKYANLDSSVTSAMRMPLFTETIAKDDILAIAAMARSRGLLKRDVDVSSLSLGPTGQ